MDYRYGFALLAGLVLLWSFGIRAFIGFVFWASSLIPFIGKKHRYARWNELNRSKEEHIGDEPPAPASRHAIVGILTPGATGEVRLKPDPT